MAAPTITSAVYQGGAQLTGLNLTHYTIPTTNKELFTDLTTELKNGASLVENAVMGGGVDLVRSSDQWVDLGNISASSGSVSFSIWTSLSNYSNTNAQGIITRSSNGVNRTPLDIEFWCVNGTLYLTIYEQYSFPSSYKNISYDVSSFSNDEWVNLGFRIDLSTGTNIQELFINGSEVSPTVLNNDSFTSTAGYDYIALGSRLDYLGDLSTIDGSISYFKYYEGVYSDTDFLNIYNNTQYYYKAGGTGNLIPIEPDSTTSTTASFSGVAVGDVIYVFNKDGSASATVEAGYTCPKYFENRIIPSVGNAAITSKTGNSEVRTANLNSTLKQTREATFLWRVHTDEIDDFMANLESNYNKTFEEDFQGRNPFENGASVNKVRIMSFSYNFKRDGETMWEIPVRYRLVE